MRICLFLLAMCVLIAPLPVASVGAEGSLLIQIQDGVISYSADGGQSWVQGVPEGAQISIAMPQPAPGLPQAGALYSFADAQGPYAMMPMQPGCCCCCQRGALNASQSSASPYDTTIPDAQPEAAPEQTGPEQTEPAQAAPTQPEAAQPEAAQADVQPRQDSAEVETQTFAVPIPDPPGQSAPSDAAEGPTFGIQIDGSEDFEAVQPAQTPSAQPPQAVPTQSPAERQAQRSLIANQTEVLLGTAADGATVWVWHDVSGNPIFSTDDGLSWSNNEPEGLVITP